MIDIELLEEQFSIEGELGFYVGEGDLVFISIFNKWADAEICLYGAHVTNYTPQGNFDVLWMSPVSDFEYGKPIRGGIPVCFPWFGPHSEDQDKPQHGFARLSNWDLIETASKETGETLVRMQLESSYETKQYWPFDFKAEMSILIGKELEVKLTITNTGNAPFEYTSALHSYFNISGIENIYISGLQNKQYYQGFGNEIYTQEEELLQIKKEENRRYINTNNTCRLIDPEFMRIINVSKEGSSVTVVWNPGEETTKKMSDLPEDSYHAFVCIESANYYDDKIVLSSGEKHTTSTIIGSEFKKGKLSSLGDTGVNVMPL